MNAISKYETYLYVDVTGVDCDVTGSCKSITVL